MKLTFADDSEGNNGELPNFASPPVVEVTCGIQFEELANYNNLMLSDFRQIVKSDYSKVEEHPALQPSFETFGASDDQIAQPKFEILNSPVPSRFFLISSDGANLLQIQKDRFHFNWRKSSESQFYPRYDAIQKPFQKALSEFQSWTTDAGLGEVRPTQSEIVYVNRIPLTLDDQEPCGLSDIFDWFEGLEGRTENGSFKFKRKLVDIDAGNSPVGRFYFELDYGTGPGGDREAFLRLTIRGRPTESDISSHLDFIDQGRAIIVQQFARVTSEKARRHWKEE